VGQRAVLEFGDDLLDVGVVAVMLVGLDDAEGGVGDERVVPVGGEQRTLPGRSCSPADSDSRSSGTRPAPQVRIHRNQGDCRRCSRLRDIPLPLAEPGVW
jgi:hypothetical protein